MRHVSRISRNSRRKKLRFFSWRVLPQALAAFLLDPREEVAGGCVAEQEKYDIDEEALIAREARALLVGIGFRVHVYLVSGFWFTSLVWLAMLTG
jgi:hypothetical protein